MNPLPSKRNSSKRKLSSLTHGRPPRKITKTSSSSPFSTTASGTLPSLSSKATRTLIRSHHQLQKAHAQALANNDSVLASELAEKIAKNGGIESYQLASKKGQSLERGGDSSSVLVTWLFGGGSGRRGDQEGVWKGVTAKRKRKTNTTGNEEEATAEVSPKLRCLEIGALSTRNAISKVDGLEVERIDLHSQEKGILEQDFMSRPLPTTRSTTHGGHEEGTFHVISLSLVLNYVPDAVGRGEMLKRTVEFLCHDFFPTTGEEDDDDDDDDDAKGQKKHDKLLKPCLFLVLPAACVLNSRYLNETRLTEMMQSLGYRMCRRKETSKLVFYLWMHDYGDDDDGAAAIAYGKKKKEKMMPVFKKVELNPGRTRNNFAIVMR